MPLKALATGAVGAENRSLYPRVSKLWMIPNKALSLARARRPRPRVMDDS
jgi:hypothetical protein